MQATSLRLLGQALPPAAARHALLLLDRPVALETVQRALLAEAFRTILRLLNQASGLAAVQRALLPPLCRAVALAAARRALGGRA